MAGAPSLHLYHLPGFPETFLGLPQPSSWDRWKSNNNPIKVSDTMARWRRAGEELGTRGLLQVVFHWLWIPTGRTLAIRFTD